MIRQADSSAGVGRIAGDRGFVAGEANRVIAAHIQVHEMQANAGRQLEPVVLDEGVAVPQAQHPPLQRGTDDIARR